MERFNSGELKNFLQSQFPQIPYWSDDRWKACLAAGGGAKRRYHLCENDYSFDALQAYRHMWPVLLCRCLRCVSCQGFPGYKKTDFFWWFLGRW